MPSNCLEVRDRLSAWLDGELAPEARTRLDRHLERCADCRRELAQLAVLDEALGALPLTAPAGLPERVLSRLRRPRRQWWQSLALAASLILGIFLGGALTHNFYPLPVQNGANLEVASLEDFHDFPQGSMGTILASYQADEGLGNGK
jgi:anti-sigma factor (TIGR02949 family)